jgi:hypothetical protein
MLSPQHCHPSGEENSEAITPTWQGGHGSIHNKKRREQRNTMIIMINLL